MKPSVIKNQIEDGSIKVEVDKLYKTMKILKTAPEFNYNYLTNLTAVDYQEYLEVIYHLYSLQTGNRLEVKVEVDSQTPKVPSVMNIWGAANWQEREVYDMFGITFNGHSNLKRILLTDDFEGHPLRKDFKLST